MAESYALSETVDATAGAPPEDRGRLTVSTTVVEHLAEAAARGVTGTVRRSSVLRKLGGRTYPRAQATVRGERAWLVLDVAATWPCAISQIATETRDRVLAETAPMSGLAIESVDVTVHVVETDESHSRRVQ